MEAKGREEAREGAKERMPPEQYKVCFMGGTEPPFTGKYCGWKGDGEYGCAACGTVLFDSETKFESGTGWPSFYEAVRENVEERDDTTLFMRRVEVVCRACGCHLGHLFRDGPPPTGLRYCVNSASVAFVPRRKQ